MFFCFFKWAFFVWFFPSKNKNTHTAPPRTSPPGAEVRTGRELSSPEASGRLSTGALIRQEELQGVPRFGWSLMMCLLLIFCLFFLCSIVFLGVKYFFVVNSYFLVVCDYFHSCFPSFFPDFFIWVSSSFTARVLFVCFFYSTRAFLRGFLWVFLSLLVGFGSVGVFLYYRPSNHGWRRYMWLCILIVCY